MSLLFFSNIESLCPVFYLQFNHRSRVKCQQSLFLSSFKKPGSPHENACVKACIFVVIKSEDKLY